MRWPWTPSHQAQEIAYQLNAGLWTWNEDAESMLNDEAAYGDS